MGNGKQDACVPRPAPVGPVRRTTSGLTPSSSHINGSVTAVPSRPRRSVQTAPRKGRGRGDDAPRTNGGTAWTAGNW
jgi:hypothetical protein